MRVHEKFRKIVEGNPGATAVEIDGHKISYYEIDLDSDALAGAINRRLGQEPEPVAIIAESWALPSAILGAMKAGKIATVLNDKDQLDYQIARTGARLIIGDTLLLTEIDRPLVEVLYNDGASMVFTSGSTGSAKCVVRTHAQTLHRAEVLKEILLVNDKLGEWRTGVSRLNVLMDGLLNGVPVSLRSDPDPDWINRQGITFFNTSATAFRYMMGTECKWPELRILSVGGEMVVWEDFKLFQKSNKFSDDCIFINRYATAETNIVSSLALTKASKAGSGRMPVGYPAPGMSYEIVDIEGRKVPDGMWGEIAVRGYLAIEYWMDQELTQRRFKVDASGRYYLTGDIGFIENGMLHHEGRSVAQSIEQPKRDREPSEGEEQNAIKALRDTPGL